MPQIIPIRDLKNTSQISDICHSSNEPVFITKNGYGDMVIMSMEAYEKTMYMYSVYDKLAQAEESITNGNVFDAQESVKIIREKYGL
ncbi:MAG: type II toxin-antitoxin system Phd/YefM family antitoxin [Candidatus Ornithomonoglobus sp.]